MVNLQKYLNGGQFFSDAYKKHVEKSLRRISTGRLGEFTIVEGGETACGVER